jgi:hypothetical protein
MALGQQCPFWRAHIQAALKAALDIFNIERKPPRQFKKTLSK